MSIIPFERSYWVISNKLIAGEIPASNNEEESKIKLMRLVEIDTKVVINLQEENEKNYQNQLFYDYSSFLNKNNIETFRMPIKDTSIPKVEKMVEILDLIDKCNLENKIVYIHCWGGVGRTGTVVVCYLIRHNLANKNNVFETIDYLKRTTSISNRMSPETNQQKDFILSWNANQ